MDPMPAAATRNVPPVAAPPLDSPLAVGAPRRNRVTAPARKTCRQSIDGNFCTAPRRAPAAGQDAPRVRAGAPGVERTWWPPQSRSLKETERLDRIPRQRRVDVRHDPHPSRIGFQRVRVDRRDRRDAAGVRHEGSTQLWDIREVEWRAARGHSAVR